MLQRFDLRCVMILRCKQTSTTAFVVSRSTSIVRCYAADLVSASIEWCYTEIVQ